MAWHVYQIGPIDFGWQHLPTVAEMAKKIGGDDAEAAPSGLGHPGGIEIDTFSRIWESAQQAAKDSGWEGDFRNDPVVFWLPDEDDFVCGFVIKQDNNGTTFVVSPHALPHVKQLE